MVSGLGSVVRTRQSALPLAPAPTPISLPGLVLIFVEPLLYARHATHALPHLRAGQLLGISVTHTYTATYSTLMKRKNRSVVNYQSCLCEEASVKIPKAQESVSYQVGEHIYVLGG